MEKTTTTQFIQHEQRWLQVVELQSKASAKSPPSWMTEHELMRFLTTKKPREKRLTDDHHGRHPTAWWGFRRYHYSGFSSEGNRFITNKDL